MKITIDTTKDSKDDILKAISLLQQLIGETVQQTYTAPIQHQTTTSNNYSSDSMNNNINFNHNTQESSFMNDTSSMLNMFNSEPAPQPQSQPENNQLFGSQNVSSDMTSFNDISSMLKEKNDDNKDNKIKIIEY